MSNRPPSLRAYLLLGASVGFLIGAALAIFGHDVPMASIAYQVLSLGVAGAALGGLVAALVYLLVDWRHEHPRLR